jgi:hypothetical protein
MTKSYVPFWAMAFVVILGFVYKAKKAAKNMAPIGYEDEKGFHFEEPE